MMTHKEEREAQNGLSIAYYDHEKGLHALAFYKVNSHTTSKDLVQDTFIKTWAYLVKGGKIELMRAFLYHILNDLIIDEYRKRKTTSLDVLLEKGFEPIAITPERMYDIMDGKRAMSLIGKLPVKYRKVMRMKYVQELSLAEMSRLTGQTKNTIAVQTHRGLEKLKLLYQHN